MKRNGAAPTHEFQERSERDRSHSNIMRSSRWPPETQKGAQARSDPRVAVLCEAVNKKEVTFEGGSRTWSEEGPAERPGGVRKEVQDDVREKDAVREDENQKCLKVKKTNWKFRGRSKTTTTTELLARVHPSCLEVEVTI